MKFSEKHNKALELYKADKLKEAKEMFDIAIGEEDNNPDLFHDRGVCFFHLGMKIEALADMNRALDIQPEYSYRYSSRAYMKGHLKDVEGAIEDYKMAISLDPEDAIAHNNLGLLEEQLGFHQQAKKRFSQADELNELLQQNGISSSTSIAQEPRNIQKELDVERKENENSSSILREMISVFTHKEKRAEFIRFVKNGFK